MANEGLLQLFDFYWFENQILRNKSNPSSSSSSPGADVIVEELEPSPLMKLSHTPSFIVRSFSDQALSSKDMAALVSSDSSSPSPKSVLHPPKLETILSGKEAGEPPSEPAAAKIERDGEGKTRTRQRRRKGSRSLSELEFEEIKGFMDLGFVFSDEDKDSSLASIIPGLQRLGNAAPVYESAVSVSRPYLSEAWEVNSDDLKAKNQLMKWRISATGHTESEIKNQIRSWAHTVASTVR